MPLLTMFAESPIHAGTGSELGHVDLPIQRERATQIPTIHSTGVKGVARDLGRRCGQVDEEVVRELFGSDPPSGPGGAALEPGALVFSDARLVLFPCRTAGPVFAWVTSPYLLNRLRRDAREAGCPGVPTTDPRPSDHEAMVTNQAAFPAGGVLLEEFDFARRPEEVVGQWAGFLRTLLPASPEYAFWRELLPRNLVVVSDDNLRDFVTYATEIVTRIRLDREKKTVETGALWTEEYLPQDSLLYSVVGVTLRTRGRETEVLARLATIVGAFPVAQFGGKETVGRGIVRLTLVQGLEREGGTP